MRETVKLVKRRLHKLLPIAHLLIALFLHFSASFVVSPILADVTMAALCPGRDKCGHAIYVTGLQNAITGIGTMIVTPILGDISDRNGRKPLLLLAFIMSVIPFAVLSYSRTKEFIYAYYMLRTLVAIPEGSVHCLSAAYVADTVEDHLRGSTYGVLGSVISIGYVLSIIFAHFLSESYVFKVATVISAVSSLYLKVFLVETSNNFPLPSGTQQEDYSGVSDSGITFLYCRPYFQDIVGTLKSSPVLLQVILVSFFTHLGEAGLQGLLLYYLKATFHFGKDQFSELMLISGSAAVISQLILLPFLLPLLGEKRVLCIGLFANVASALLYGTAWAVWVPYLSAAATMFSVFVFSSIASIVSREAGAEQGKIQGLIAAVHSLASIISPLAISPLTAFFLSENPPFHCHGFSIICAAFVMVIAFIQGCLMSHPSPSLSQYRESGYMQVHSISVSEQ